MVTSSNDIKRAAVNLDDAQQVLMEHRQQNEKHSDLVEHLLNFSVDGYQWLAPIKGRSKVVM